MESYILNGGKLLNKAIKKAQSDGKNTLTITDNYEIEETVLIPSHFHLILDNCRLRMADNTFCNLFRNEHADDGIGDTAIRIEGRNGAVLDGGMYNGLSERSPKTPNQPPMTVQNLILFANVSDFEVSGLSFYHQRWWAINNYACHHGVFRNLHFEADDRRYIEDGTLVHKLDWDTPYANIYIHNADGIDIRRGCHDILIENISGFTEDDTVACTLLHGDGEKQYVPENVCPDIHDIKIRHIHAAAFCSLVRLLSQSDGMMYNITVEDVIECDDEVKAHMKRGLSALRIGDDTKYGDYPNDENRMHHITATKIRSGGDFVVDLAGKMRDITIDDYTAENAQTQLLRSTADGTNIILCQQKAQ